MVSSVVELYETHRDGIYRFLVCQGLNPGDAQELTQDVFIDLHQALAKGVVIDSPKGWLYTVATRSAIDHQRRMSGRVEISLQSETGLMLAPPSNDPSPEFNAEEQERHRRMASGLAKLPNEQLLCIQLRLRGLRYREIAQAVRAPVSTVADRLAAAVAFLRQYCE